MKKLIGLVIPICIVLFFGLRLKGESCKRPLPWQKQQCQEVEQAILDATVRLVFHGTIEVEDGYEVHRIQGGVSHATVIDGRYLITHNHFGIPLSQVQLYNRYANGEFSGVSVYRLDGTAVVDHAPLDVFVVLEEKGETVLLDFGTVAGEGFFTHAGFNSVQAVVSDAIQLPPGTEVAQIDWDRKGHTKVVWTQVQSVREFNGLPVVRIEHFIEKGASGGGVFLQGQHIGNNWGRINETNPSTGIVKHHLSLVALNS